MNNAFPVTKDASKTFLADTLNVLGDGEVLCLDSIDCGFY